MDYNKTLNLPKTEFPMRASLPQREPEFLKGWEKRKLYNQLMEHNEGKPLFVLHDGPPYANGSIHIGHALNKTLKDFIVRYKNMTGFKSPYVPGWDTHVLPTELAARKKAGITAESNISDLELRKICRDTALGFVDIQREGFKRLGVMAEWDHPYITLQKEFEQEQIKVFAQMASKGYIYKGLKPVYWCPDCKTALAEAEIEYAEDPCHSIYVKFKVTDDMGKLTALGAELDKTYFVIWTTTTWTLPANVAICVGPNYEYSVLKANGEYYVMATDLAPEAMADAGITDYETVGIIKGSELEYMKTAHPFIDRTSLVIVGDHVTLESGTGCVHTAPGHGVDDFVVCRKYPEIPIVVPVDENGVLTEEAGQFAGLTTDEANKPIAEHLEKLGALFALKKIKHQYPHCWRCHKPIIFRATSQWFCSVDDFKDAAVKAAEDVKWYPEWGKDRLQSMVVERADWCISRQLWWGHRIPAWYCDDCGEVMVAKDAPEKCCKCGSTHIHQDEDTLDTWFSSALWPFSTLGWPDKTPELEYFYPTSTLVTGYDIIFFWVARMIFSACENMGSAPFKTVFMHGIVRDENGIKMSKSLGNGIDPLEVIDKYGADALRFFLATGNTPGNDMRYSDKRVEACANFANKLWNASRYVHMNIDDHDVKNELPKTLTTEDKWIVSTLNTVAKEVNENLEKFELGIAVQKIYEFIWDCYCDWYIELVKTRLSSDGEDAQNARQVLLYVLDQILRLLHPFMPYITEEIWQTIPHEGETVMLAKYPEYNADLDYPEASDEMKKIMDAIRAIRNRRAEMNVPPSRKAKVYVATKFADTFRDGTQFIQKLASASEVEVAESFEIEGAVNIVTADAKIYIPMDELVDREKELARLNKELEQVKKRLAQSEDKLNNQGFVAKAPEAVIEKVKGQAAKEREQIALIEAAIAALK